MFDILEISRRALPKASTLLAAGVLVALPAITQSATLSYEIRTTATDADVSITGADIENLVAEDVALNGTFDVSAGSNLGRSNSSAKISVDGATGAVKFGAFAATGINDNRNESVRGTSILNWELNEVFRVTGVGTATFSLAVDGILQETAAAGGAEGTFVDSKLEVFTSRFNTGEDRFFDNSSLYATAEPILIDQTLSVSLDVTDGQNLFVRLSGDARASTALAFEAPQSSSANFLNTAVLSFVTTGTVSLAASDPAFLAGTPISPVPVPASLPLLGVGFAALFGLRRRGGAKRG